MNQQQSQSGAFAFSSSSSSAVAARRLTDEGQAFAADLAGRHGFGEAAVATMLAALAHGHGGQAQFDHPELGGLGQWSRGGMLMIGDMFNHELKARVAALAQEAAAGFARGGLFASPPTAASGSAMGQGGGPSPWPSDLGMPAATGSQNNMQYAFFPKRRRLAIVRDGVTEVYDTGDHQILSFGQQQGGGSSLGFTSQFGPVSLDTLQRVEEQRPREDAQAEASRHASPGHAAETAAGDERTRAAVTARSAEPDTLGAQAASEVVGPRAAGGETQCSAIIAAIEGLAGLHAKGILSDEEFADKKTELLARL